MQLQPHQSITILKGVGPAIQKKLAELGLHTIQGLVYFFPRRYDDFSKVTPLADLQPGAVTVKVRVEKVTARHVRRGLHLTEAILADHTSKIRALWFNQPYRPDSLKEPVEFYMSGTFDFQRDRFVLQNPVVEKVSQFAKNTARIVPVYPLTKGLKAHQLRGLVQQLLPLIRARLDTLPPEIVAQERLMSLAEALAQIHFPETSKQLQEAKHRLAFEELFVLLLASYLNKQAHAAQPGQAIPYRQEAAAAFVAALPFQLTNAQRRAAWQLLQDMTRPKPMNRLLQGDVGSGKTVVAAFAAFMARCHQVQTAFMAPTEVLAAQHAETLSGLLESLGVHISLLSGSVKGSQRELVRRQLKEGLIDIVVGTHALIQDETEFANLGLAVIDEQHRFGVNQRAALLAKRTRMPHLLSMTATPIPRSLSLTLYGELDISLIDERPPGRQPVVTEICSPLEREKLYRKIDAQIDAGRQVYIVCPLVSESDTLGLKSVEAEYERLNQTVFLRRRIALLHGKLTSPEKETVMRQFQRGELDILLSTTVVEVGVNVPNATIMLIEGAERFGLSQLHQLRGRVGRGEAESFCYLVPSTVQSSTRRLQEVVRSDDGFYLAEADLKFRGPGDLFGTRQHGSFSLRIATMTDTKLISQVQRVVQAFMATAPDLRTYPELYQRVETLRQIRRLN